MWWCFFVMVVVVGIQGTGVAQHRRVCRLLRQPLVAAFVLVVVSVRLTRVVAPAEQEPAGGRLCEPVQETLAAAIPSSFSFLLCVFVCVVPIALVQYFYLSLFCAPFLSAPSLALSYPLFFFFFLLLPPFTLSQHLYIHLAIYLVGCFSFLHLGLMILDVGCRSRFLLFFPHFHVLKHRSIHPSIHPSIHYHTTQHIRLYIQIYACGVYVYLYKYQGI
jgi:hypothetical protein